VRKLFSVTCLFVLMVGVFMSCKDADKKDASTVKEEANKSSPQTSAAHVELKSEEKQHQYRAVCISKEEHGGNEQVLSTWLDSRDEAKRLGLYHGEFKYQGHRWRIEERVTP
jgi:hypothetical protein